MPGIENGGWSDLPMPVLVTDGNERSALAVTRALGQQGIRIIVGSEHERSLAAASKYCWRTFSYPSPYINPNGFVSRLLDIVERFRATAMFPMTDIAMLLAGQHRKEFEKYTAVPTPPVEVFESLSDKYYLMQLASDLKIPIPETIFLPNGDVKTVLDHIQHYPVVVKPARSLTKIAGRWCKTRVHYAVSPTDLLQLYSDIDYLQEASMIQERVEGRGQGLFVLMKHGEPLALFAHQRLRERPPSGGVSVLSESIPLPQPMTEYALRLLRQVGWHGVAMVEFKVDRRSDQPVLMEVNGRFWGSLQLAVDAGVNFPFLLYQVATGENPEPSLNGYRVGLKSRWLLGDLDHLLLRLFKPMDALSLPPESPSKCETLLAFCSFFQRGMRYDVLRVNDPKPFFYELRQYIKHLVTGNSNGRGNSVAL